MLTTFIVSIPDGTADEVVHDLTTREAQRADQLAQQGNPCGSGHCRQSPARARRWSYGEPNPSELHAIQTSLPLDPRMTTQTTPATAVS